MPAKDSYAFRDQGKEDRMFPYRQVSGSAAAVLIILAMTVILRVLFKRCDLDGSDDRRATEDITDKSKKQNVCAGEAENPNYAALNLGELTETGKREMRDEGSTVYVLAKQSTNGKLTYASLDLIISDKTSVVNQGERKVDYAEIKRNNPREKSWIA
ncbi:uncharacterized protein LOC144492307 [Mustelus asterias]